MPLRPLAPLALLGALLLAACDNPSSNGEPTPRVSFSYSGARSGSFSVTAPRPPAGPRTQSFVEGLTPGNNAFFVRSFSIRTGEIADAVLIQGPWAPGSYAVGSCGAVPLCPAVSGTFDSSLTSVAREGERGWYLTQGTLTIDTPLREGRIRGRFSGTAAVSVYSFGSWQSDGVLTISDGSFEADLLEHAIGG